MTLRRLVKALALVAVLAVVGGLGLAWQEGYRVYMVRTGSMAPTLSPGDAVIDAPPASSYQVDDIVTAASGGPDPLVTHRITEVGDGEVITQGDANDTADIEPVPVGHIVGRMIARVPHGGYAMKYLQHWAGLVSLLTATLTIIFGWRLWFPSTDRQPEAQGSPARLQHCVGL